MTFETAQAGYSRAKSGTSMRSIIITRYRVRGATCPTHPTNTLGSTAVDAVRVKRGEP